PARLGRGRWRGWLSTLSRSTASQVRRICQLSLGDDWLGLASSPPNPLSRNTLRSPHAAVPAIGLDGTGEAVLRSLFKDLKNRARVSDGERGDPLRPIQARSWTPRIVGRRSAGANSPARA